MTETFEIILNTMIAIGTFLTGLSVVFGIYKYIDSLLVKKAAPSA